MSLDTLKISSMCYKEDVNHALDCVTIIMMGSMQMEPTILYSKCLFQGICNTHNTQHENRKTCGRGCRAEIEIIVDPNLANQVLVGAYLI